MEPELIGLAAGILGLGGLGGLWWQRRASRAHVIRAQTDWVRAGEVIHYGPVGAACFGTRPLRRYRRAAYGALGITRAGLVFDGGGSARCDVTVPLDRVRWISLVGLPARIRPWGSGRRLLAVHYDSPDGWRTAVFHTPDPLALADLLGHECDLPVHDAGSARDDFGPVRSTRMHQDVYGEWSAGRDAALYLAPDRLLFDWRDAIPLDRIRHIDALAAPASVRSPRAPGLLRIEHDPPGDGDEASTDGVAVTGFLVHQPGAWAAAIQARRADPLTIRAGRKKKT